MAHIHLCCKRIHELLNIPTFNLFLHSDLFSSAKPLPSPEQSQTSGKPSSAQRFWDLTPLNNPDRNIRACAELEKNVPKLFRLGALMGFGAKEHRTDGNQSHYGKETQNQCSVACRKCSHIRHSCSIILHNSLSVPVTQPAVCPCPGQGLEQDNL